MIALSRLITLTVSVLIIVMSVRTGWTSSFSVAPVRVLLSEQHRTERLAVTNESDRPLTLLIKAYRWTQTAEGKDRYDESAEIIIFPRVLTMAAGEERFVRVGISSGIGVVEHAFRIYLEEQPIKNEQVSEGATGRILMRVGIPVFAQPHAAISDLKSKDISVIKGILRFTLANGGNSFVMAEQIEINGFDDKGKGTFDRNLGGLYLLAGSARMLEVTIPGDICRRISRISVTTRHEGKEEHAMLDLPAGACTFK